MLLRTIIIRSLLIIGVTSLVYCGQEEKEKPMFTLLTDTGIEFANNIHNTVDFNIFSYRNFYNGGGVAIGDINNDGLADVFFTANMGSNKLYLNKGDFKFEDISTKAGFAEKKDWSTGVVMVDINADGWLDIYVCNAGYVEGRKPRSQLFINNRNLSFTDKAAEYGLTNEGGYTTHAAFFDYDLDKDLDCFIINNSFIPVNTLNYANKRALRAPDWPVADFLKGGGDHLYRNDEGKFVDVSKDAGIYGSLISFGLGVTVGDVDGDHYPDIYVSNDFFERDYLYMNQRNGTFRDELEERTQHISHSSMGADMADINNDGYPDIFTTDMLPDDDYRLKTTTSFDNIDVTRIKQNSGFFNQYTQNTLQVNNRQGKFLETGFYSGVAASDWSWGGLIFDANNDGLSDIFVCNGIYNDVTNQDFIDFFANDVIQNMVLTGKKEQFEEIVNKMPSEPIPNKFYLNQGNLKFTDYGNTAGLGQPSFSNGSAYGDLDNDGDLDLIVSNVNEKAFIYRNETNAGQQNYISVMLKGPSPNTFAVGSKIWIYTDSQVINRELIPTRGFQSSVDYRQVIGIGKSQVDSMLIVWPDGTITKKLSPAVNQLHNIEYASGPSVFADSALRQSSPLFAKIEAGFFEKHKEDDFIDFYSERNIPVMLSREGPHADTADVNADGFVDLFIGGAMGQPGQLYLGSAAGFARKKVIAFESDKDFEDVAVLFIDADGDGDADLFVGAGGNVQPRGSRLLNHRLYRNTGTGDFESVPEAFPANNMNIAVAVANDVDNDGDADLFVGARSVPQSYGEVPESVLFINDGHGKFSPIVRKQIAMVTDAVFADIEGNSDKELIVVGEWTSPRVFKCTSKAMNEVTTSLTELQGWWQTVAATDLDDDGDTDLVLGNVGENCYLQPSSTQPVKLWIHDFDQNGTLDKIMTRTVNKKDVPVFLKRELTEQMPSLKKQNLKFVDYATKSVQDLFSSEAMGKAKVYEFKYASSAVAINKGKGQFDVEKLPVFTQLSCVNAIAIVDLNADAKMDLVLGGNQFYLQPQFARLDASYGHVLINNSGKSAMSGERFSYMMPAETGFVLPGAIKDLLATGSGNDRRLIVIQNNDFPVLYKLNKH